MFGRTKTLILENALLVVFISLVVLLVLLQANPITSYPSRDGGAFTYIGHIILEGKHLYVDAWDSKPPAIFYLNAFALWLGRDTFWGIWLVEFAFLFGAACIGYKVMKTLWQPGPAIIGTIVWVWGLNRVLSGGNFTEEYPLLFNFFAIYAFWKSIQKPKMVFYDLAIGFSLALSFIFRANNIGIQISIILTWLVILICRKEFWLLFQKLSMICIGALVILSMVCLYFFINGSLKAMVDAAIVYNFYYGGGNSFNLWHSSIVQGFIDLGGPAWVALAGYIIILWRMAKGIINKRLEEMTLFLFVGWPMEMILSGVSGRGYGHYFISWLPIVSLLCGLAFSFVFIKIFRSWVGELFNKQLGIVLLILITASLVLFWKDWGVYKDSFYKVAFDRKSGIEAVQPVAQYIQENTTLNETVLIWGGQAGLNFMAKRDSPTAYIFYPGYITSPIASKADDIFLHDITTRPPALIVDAYIAAPDDILSLDPGTRQVQIAAGKGQTFHPNNLDRVFEFVESHYKLETRIANYAIYRLAGTP